MTKSDPFKGFHSSPEIIRLAVMLYIRFPISLRNVEELLHERGVDISHETVRYWWHRFGPMFASEIRKRRIEGMKSSRWRWHQHVGSIDLVGRDLPALHPGHANCIISVKRKN